MVNKSEGRATGTHDAEAPGSADSAEGDPAVPWNFLCEWSVLR